jgi:hypothetical protein
VTRELVQPRKVGLTFSVQANNPSGRARFYYTPASTAWSSLHYRKTGHFRRPLLISSAKEAADENIQFISSAKTVRRNYDLFSSAQKGRRKNDSIFVG